MMAVVYAALALPAVIGMLARGQRVWPVAIGGALASSLIFYATTNFAVWAFSRAVQRGLPRDCWSATSRRCRS